MTPGSLHVLLVHARPLQRKGLVAHLTEMGVERVTDVPTPDLALREIRSGRPLSVVVWGLPQWQEVLSRLTVERPVLPVLVLSGLRERETAPLALRAGAAGFVSCHRALDELPVAIRVASGGGRYVSPVLASVFADTVANGRELRTEGALSGLSLREAQVVRLIALGMRREEIARHMAVQPCTVTTYRKRALAKLGLRSAVDLTRYAIRHGVVSNEAPVVGVSPTAR